MLLPCIQCDREISDSAARCPYCGYDYEQSHAPSLPPSRVLTRACIECRREISESAGVCPYCGYQYAHAVPPPDPLPDVLGKTVQSLGFFAGFWLVIEIVCAMVDTVLFWFGMNGPILHMLLFSDFSAFLAAILSAALVKLVVWSDSAN